MAAQNLAPVSPTLASREFSFTAEDFGRIRDLIYRRVGISLSDRKSEMVYSRLARRLRVVNFGSFRDYLDALEKGSNFSCKEVPQCLIAPIINGNK